MSTKAAGSLKMTIEEILKLIESAKEKGLEEITIDEDLADEIVGILSDKHNFAILFANVFDKNKNTQTIISWNEEKVKEAKWAAKLGNTWNYQVIYHDNDKFPFYGLHEVFPYKDGTVGLWTKEPVAQADSIEDLKDAIKTMLNDIIKRPVLVLSELEKNNDS